MFFEPYVRQWLLNTDSKTKNWVEAVGIPYGLFFGLFTLRPGFSLQAIAQDKVLIWFRIDIIFLIFYFWTSSLNQRVQKDIVRRSSICLIL